MKVCRHCSHMYIGSPRRCWTCGARLSQATNGAYVFWGLVACAILVAIITHLHS